MSYIDHCQELGCRNLRFGLKTPPGPLTIRQISKSETEDWPIIEHYNGCCPAQTQWLDSCESEATANFLEWWLWKHAGNHLISLDAQAIYRHARCMLYDGKLEGGLLLGDSAKALIDMGILPSSTKIRRIPLNAISIVDALQTAPLITGHRIWDGWWPKNLNPENGCIDESQDGEFGMGHATLCVGTNLHNEHRIFVHLNSWGSFLPTRGLFAMTAGYSIRNMLDCAIQLDIPTEWSESDLWAKIIMPHPKS